MVIPTRTCPIPAGVTVHGAASGVAASLGESADAEALPGAAAESVGVRELSCVVHAAAAMSREIRCNGTEVGEERTTHSPWKVVSCDGPPVPCPATRAWCGASPASIRIWGDARRPWEQPPGDDIVREGSGRETLTLTTLRWSTSLLEAI